MPANSSAERQAFRGSLEGVSVDRDAGEFVGVVRRSFSPPPFWCQSIEMPANSSAMHDPLAKYDFQLVSVDRDAGEFVGDL